MSKNFILPWLIIAISWTCKSESVESVSSSMTVFPCLQSVKSGSVSTCSSWVTVRIRVLHLFCALLSFAAQAEQSELVQVQVKRSSRSFLNRTTLWMQYTLSSLNFNHILPSFPGTVIDLVSQSRSIACAAEFSSLSSLVPECSALSGSNSPGSLPRIAEIELSWLSF